MNIKSPDGTPRKTLADAHSALLNATEEYHRVDAVYQKSLMERQCAIKKLDQAQNTFDAAVQGEKASAPGVSAWKRSAPVAVQS